MQLSRIVLIGRMTRDPEERFTNDGMETSKFCVAVNRPGKPREGEKNADFFNVVCFRHSAKFANQYLRRGNLVAVEGRLQIDEYTDREGAKRTWVEVVADNVQNLTPRGEAGEATPAGRRDADRDFDDDEPSQRPSQRGREQRQEQRSGGGQRKRGYTDADDDSDPFADE